VFKYKRRGNNSKRERIIALLRSEVAYVQNPKNPAEIYKYSSIEELAQVFIDFLKFHCNEPMVEGIGIKIITVLSVFADTLLDSDKLNGALEDLATGFESFLKKLGVLRYEKDTIKLYGDGVNYQGLLHTALGTLLVGKC